MKNLTELSKNITYRKLSEIYDGNHNPKMHMTDEDKKLIDLVFKQMTCIFSAWAVTWKDTEVISNTKKEWSKAFFENGIYSMDQIQIGFVKARSSGTDFLPSPGKFISWCKPNPEDMGYPSVEKAKMLCIAHRAKTKLSYANCSPTRPLIAELFTTIDWWVMDAGVTPKALTVADKHFESKYLELISSGYQEPVETSSPRLETSEITKPRMSEKQVIESKQVGNDAIAKFRKQIKSKGGLNNGY